jgi:hypothetical protein
MTDLRPSRNGSLIVREVDGELVVLDTQANRVHKLNRTAGAIWRRCGSAASPAEIARDLAEEFDVDPDIALQDVLVTLEQLRALNLLENA